MNLLKTCLYICMLLIMFTLVINFVDSTSAFDTKVESGVETQTSDNDVLEVFTNNPDQTVNNIWLVAVGSALVGAAFLAAITHSIVPIGIHLFSTIFWTSYLRAWAVISAGGFTEDLGGFMIIFTAAVMFLFIGAIVSMLTGSG